MKDVRVTDQVVTPVKGGRSTGSVIAIDGDRAQVAWTPGFRISWIKINRLTVVRRIV